MNFSTVPPLPNPSAQPGDQALRMQLHYCDFCQQVTLHSRQADEKKAALPEVSSSGVSEGELLQCTSCEAYTLA